MAQYNCWEQPTLDRIEEVRAREIKRIRFQEWVNAANRFIMFASPILVGVVTFVSYSLITDGDLDAGNVFAATLLFNVLRMYRALMPRAFSTIAQQQISEKRIAKFLQLEEYEAALAGGESVIQCPSSLNVLKATYDHSCYLARSDEYQHLMTDSPAARPCPTRMACGPRLPAVASATSPSAAATSAGRSAGSWC